MCQECTTEMYRWLDTKPSQMVRSGIRLDASAAYDFTVDGMWDTARGRYEDWRSLVNFQIGLIREHCAREHQESGLGEAA